MNGSNFVISKNNGLRTKSLKLDENCNQMKFISSFHRNSWRHSWPNFYAAHDDVWSFAIEHWLHWSYFNVGHVQPFTRSPSRVAILCSGCRNTVQGVQVIIDVITNTAPEIKLGHAFAQIRRGFTIVSLPLEYFYYP